MFMKFSENYDFSLITISNVLIILYRNQWLSLCMGHKFSIADWEWKIY